MHESDLSGAAGVMPAVARCRAILTSLLGNRERLLEAFLDGPYNFRLKCTQLTRGLPVSDQMIDMMWHYIAFRQGANPRYEYEMLVMKREAKEAMERQEMETLRELYALSHGKNREEEEAKIAHTMAAPENARLPELPKL